MLGLAVMMWLMTALFAFVAVVIVILAAGDGSPMVGIVVSMPFVALAFSYAGLALEACRA